MRILIVDDIPENLYLLRTLLNTEGYEVTEAANGKEALESARQTTPDLIIADILMPVMDGFALCRAWKNDPALKSIPFVFLTATYTGPKDEAFALNLGADLFLIKPQEGPVFLRKIERVLEKGRGSKRPAVRTTEVDDDSFYQQYSVRLVSKLEAKLEEIERKNQELTAKERALRTANERLEQRMIERIAAHEALQESEGKYRGLFEYANDAIYLIDPETTRIIDCNGKAALMDGYNLEELKGKTVIELHPEDELKALHDIFKELADKGSLTGLLGMHHLRKDGRLVAIEVSATVLEIGGKRLYLAIARDVTERQRTERTIKNIAAGVSAKTGKAFFQSLVVHLAKLFDADFALIGVVAGDTLETVDTLALYIHGEIIDNVSYPLKATPCENVIGQNTCTYASGVRQRFPRDEMLTEIGADSYIGTPLFDSTGHPLGLIAVLDSKPLRDTGQEEEIIEIFAARASAEIERLRAEEALRESEERFHKAFRASPDPIIISRAEDGMLIEVNDGFERITGFCRNEALGKNLLELNVWRNLDDRARWLKVLQKEGKVRDFETGFRTKSGDILICQISSEPIELGGQPCLVSIARDITERKRMDEELNQHRDHLEELVEERTRELRAAQDELLRSERLATLGQLTATVSHELRNPLGTLRTSLYSITDKLQGKKLGVDRALARMGRNITRCDNIIHEMLDFSRILDLDLQPAPIDDLLAEVLVEQTAPKGITTKQNLAAGVEAHVDIERLRRAIINVFDNACQVLSEMREEDKRKRVVTVGTQVRNDRLEITVDDTGPGIPDTILDHIFEPLYSTKGFGVGLGLPIVKQIMEQHRGGVEVSSEEGRGTHVVLWLPLPEGRQ